MNAIEILEERSAAKRESALSRYQQLMTADNPDADELADAMETLGLTTAGVKAQRHDLEKDAKLQEALLTDEQFGILQARIDAAESAKLAGKRAELINAVKNMDERDLDLNLQEIVFKPQGNAAVLRVGAVVKPYEDATMALRQAKSHQAGIQDEIRRHRQDHAARGGRLLPAF